MGWTNYHIHSDFCDGSASMEDFVKKAVELEMNAIGFSSHAPVPFHTRWNLPAEDMDDYREEIRRLKIEYADRIDIFTSLEVDYIPGVQGPGDEKVRSLGLDYVIGSLHFLGELNNGDPWTIDCPFPEFICGLQEIYNDDIKQLVFAYYNTTREMVQRSTPDIIGHLDRVKMQNKIKPLFDENADWYRDELYFTLEMIRDNNVIVEINTKAVLRNGMVYPGKEYFTWLKELEIPIVMNSDAHQPEYLIDGFKEVSAMLKDAGVRYRMEIIDGGWTPVRI